MLRTVSAYGVRHALLRRSRAHKFGTPFAEISPTSDMSGRVFLPAYVANPSDGGVQLDLPSAGYKHSRALQQPEWPNSEHYSPTARNTCHCSGMPFRM
jgi:hypothetical protein